MKILKPLLLLLLVVSLTFAQSPGHSFGYEIVKNPLGKLILKAKVEVADKGLFLGVSIYPPNVVNLLDEGIHFSIPVKQGIFVREFEIEPVFENGTFEAALWTGKLTKDQCPPDDAICQKLGYKHTGMASYVWGYLKTK
ncbi:MAG: hypothetical protein ACRDGA_09185 [Bacteroidota bacterium]